MLSRSVYNPYLPGNEYIPDGEPRVFGDRLYVYGSHDRFNGVLFCLNDYVAWSAPVNDLSDWRCEGPIFRKRQDPHNWFGVRLLFAPDVVQGPDGRFYLYYGLDFSGLLGVAVCDEPAGKFQFLGYVQHPDGTLWGRKEGDFFPFDPGVLVDDGRVFLYSGFALGVPRMATGGKRLRSDGGVVAELAPDMRTLRTVPRLLFPKSGSGSFAGHEFFEASSIRKIDGRYCFVYSSRLNHELCCAWSDRPDGDFVFGGTLVSQGDLGLDGVVDESRARNYLGNTHGGLVELQGQWFVFYHRQTNRHSYSRQACAEPLRRRADGGFFQSPVSSCGLNRGPLATPGLFPARIACHLWAREGTGRYDGPSPQKRLSKHPYHTQDRKDGDPKAVAYIANLRDGAVAGFRSFRFEGIRSVTMELRGRAEGCFEVSSDPDFRVVVGTLPVQGLRPRTWSPVTGPVNLRDGVADLYFRFRGSGRVDFLSFRLN